MNLAWRLKRAAAMERGEVAWRVKQLLYGLMQRGGAFVTCNPPRACDRSGRAWIAPWPGQFDVDKYRAAADRILAGEFRVFSLDPAQLGFPPRWNRDPKTSREAPMQFGKFLDYRDERVVGDIKYLWEPARHAELVTLAQAWRLTLDDRYGIGCRVLLQSWLDQCPYLRGPHWTSSLELGVRLVNWSLTWQLLGGFESPLFRSAEEKAFRDRWLASVYQHCHFVAGHLSRYSSANNHLLGELLGLFVAALAWPCWRESSRWAALARREFEEQALAQNAADGVNREQAVWYHHEVADMMLMAGLVGRANGLEFSSEYWRRLESMIEFIAGIMDRSGSVPAFGDSDDAVIARLDPDRGFDVYASLLATGAVLCNRPEFAFKARRFDDKSRWLLGDAAAASFQALHAGARATAPARRAFQEGGYYILGRDFETADEVRIVFDAGPLGYRSIAAHGHADALSFTMSVAGAEVLVDPGTFAYHTQRRWRDYFRGTSAHNTVRVDGLDQSQSGGNFLWMTRARARIIELDLQQDYERILAEHDGYRRLQDPVLHRRELRLDRSSRILTVVDELICSSEHRIELFWHFSECCHVALIGDKATIRSGDVVLQMTMPRDARCELFQGSDDPILGWRSLRFDERVASPALRVAMTIRGNTRMVTRIALPVHRAQPGPRASRLREAGSIVE